MGQQTTAATGMNYRVQTDVSTSDMGPALLGIFAFYLLVQGMIYIFRPEMSSRAMVASKEKMRRNGFVLCLIGGVMMYATVSWWMDSWTGGIAQGVR